MRLNLNPIVMIRASLSLLLAVALLPPLTAAAQMSSQTIVLRVETPNYLWDASGLHVPGYATLDTPGAPALPMWSTLVELPPNGRWTLRVEPGEVVPLALEKPLPTVPVPQLDLNGPTAWQGRADLPGAVPMAERPDPAIFGQNAFYPPQVAVAGPEQWQRGRRLLAVRAFPFQVNPVSGQVRYYPALRITVAVDAAAASSQHAAAIDLPSPLTTPDEIDGALRIRTGQRGLYRLTYSDLQAAGVPLATLNPATLAVTYLNQPVDIQVTGAADGRFDPGDRVIFYAQPYEGRYMTHNVYRLTYGGADPGQRMAERAVTPQSNDPLITAMSRTARVERNVDYRSLYPLPQGADRWFDNALFVNSYAPVASTSYAFEGDAAIAPLAGTATVRLALHGGTAQTPNPDQSLSVRLNDHDLGAFQWEGSTPYLATTTVSTAWLDQTPNRIRLEAALAQLPGITFYWVSPDWVEITYPAALQAAADRLYVEAIPATGQRARVRAQGFSVSGVRVYDVRDPGHPVQLTTIQPSGSAGQWSVDFWDQWPANAAAPSYFLASDDALLAPLAVETDAPSKLLSPTNNADYIAIVHASLAGAVQPLLDRRAAEGLRVKKVDVQDIYDEVSGGRVDPEAIRTFLTYAYQHWNQTEGQAAQGVQSPTPPQYVLLVGDGHYDFKNHAGSNLPNLIPPYLLHIDPFLGETAADNRYVSVDGPDDILPDMHLGRIPAKTPADVTAYVAKVAAYEGTVDGDWQERTVFVADDYADPAGNFHALSDIVRLNWLPPAYQSAPIYYRMDASHDTGPEMRAAIKTALNASAIYLQWFGHASQFRWGSVAMFDILDPPTLDANAQLPFVAHYGCWSGYFIGIQGSPQYNRNEQALGEALLLTPGRGAIVDLSPSGLHIGAALLDINKGLVKALFQDGVTRAGAAVDAARLDFFQNNSLWLDVIDTSILFGDPALAVRVAQLNQRHVFLPLVQAR